MPRTADYAIQGFLYQFNKTLLEVITASDDSEITVEGITEDIEVVNLAGMTAIQCKYHEAKEQFVLSIIYKPLLQMMHHFCNNPGCQVRYILFAHFPNKFDDGNSHIYRHDLESALNSANSDFAKYIQDIQGKINLDDFLKCFRLEFGSPFDELVNKVCTALQEAGIDKSDIDTLAYPNAIHFIAMLSTNHDEQARKLTKQQLISKLKTIKQTAISRWTLALKTRKQLIEAKRNQLEAGLSINTRLRYFAIFSELLDDFEQDIVMFIKDYLERYHYKTAHTKTPIFCLDTTEEKFNNIQYRLHTKGIICADGMIAGHFDETYFFRQPMINKDRQKQIQREFSIRILQWQPHSSTLNNYKADDLFLLGEGNYQAINKEDVNIELLAATNLKEIRYMLGMNNVYE